MKTDQVPLSDPAERERLEPFATIFTDVIVPEALAGGWFESRQAPDKKTLKRISRRIESHLKQRFGHDVHPAIYIHALPVCSHFFYQSAAATKNYQQQERQTSIVDAACSLIQSLLLHHDLWEIYLRLS